MIPIKAIILNLLSVGAAYGVLVWIFQDGHLQGLLGFHSSGAVVTWLPLFLFTVLFGLSMDYHVFILSRVKELVDQGVPTDQAVERGIRTTASTVTSAAAVMIAVFAIFASLSALDIKQLGVGLAVAVLDRRDPDPRRAAAGRDEAARRLELVPAPLARMDARAERRSQAGRGRTLGATGPGRMIATERYDVAVIGGGQAGLAIGYFLKRQETAVRDLRRGRFDWCGVARSLGFTRPLHSAPLRQPSWTAFSGRPRGLPDARRGRRLPRGLRRDLQAAGRAR